MAKKADLKPKTEEKAAAKKQDALPKTKRVPKVYVKKAEPKPVEFNWTEKRKQEAHVELLKLYNKFEPSRRSTLNVSYGNDGVASVRGIAKSVYSYNSK